MRLSPIALLPPLVVVFAACGDAVPAADTDTAAPAPVDLEIATTVEGLVTGNGRRWLGPDGLRVDVEPTRPLTRVTLTVRDERGDRVVGIDDVAPWRLSLNPATAGLSDGERLALVVRAYAADGGETQTTPVVAFVDLGPPEIAATDPALPAVGTEVVPLTFDLADEGAGADVMTTEVAVAWRGPDGDGHALAEGTDFTRTAMGPSSLQVEMTAQLEGRYDLTLVPVDRVGNRGEATRWTYTADATPPALTVDTPTDGDLLSDIAAVEAWAVDALLPGTVTITARLSDAAGGAVDAASGSLALDTTGLDDGSAQLGVTASDAAGNTVTVTRSVTIDNDPPEVAILSPAPGTWVLGQLALTLTARDEGAGVARVDARVGGQPEVVATSTSGPGGVYTLPLSLSDGEHTVWVDAVDGLGHTRTANVLVAADVSPPELTVEPTAGSSPTRTLPTWRITTTDRGVGVDLDATADTVRLTAADGAVYPTTTELASTGLSVTGGEVPSGSYSLEVRGVDSLGNTSGPLTTTWEIDRTPPSVTLSVAMDAVWSGEVDPSWTTADTDLVTATWLDIEDATAQRVTLPGLGPPWHAPVDSASLVDGLVRATVTAVDRAGNTATDTAWVLVDNTPPAVIVTSPLDGRHAAPSFVFRAAVHEGTSGVVSCELREAGGPPLADLEVVGRPTGAVPCALAVTLDAEGPHTLVVNARDAAGLVGEATVTIQVDAAVPAASVAPAGGVVTELPTVTFTISDTVGDGADATDAGPDLAASADTLVVTVDGEPVGGWTSDLDEDARTITLTWAASTPDGHWRVTLSPLDRVGNVGEQVAASFVLDTSAPELTASTPAPGEALDGAVAIALEVADLSAVERVGVSLVDRHGGSVAAELEAAPWRTTLETSGLADGTATLILTADDEVGHTGSLAIPVVIDNKAPAVAVNAPAADAFVPATPTLSLALRDDGVGVASVVVRAPVEVVVGQAAFDPPIRDDAVEITLELTGDGPLALEVVATDGLGRSATITHPVVVDATPPSVTAKPLDGAILGPDPTVMLFVDDGDDPASAGPDMSATAATLQLTRLGETLTGYSASMDGRRLDLRITDKRTGPIEVRLAPTDLVGNVATQVVTSYTLDQEPPSVTGSEPEDDANQVPPAQDIAVSFDEPMDALSLSGAVRVTADGVPVAGEITVDPAQTTVRFTPTYPFGPLVTVEVQVSETVTDRVGNALGEDVSFGFSVAPYRFRDVAAETGLGAYRGGTGETGEDHGPGGTFADLTGDGFPDLVLGTEDGEALAYYVNVAAPGTPIGRRFEPWPLVPDALPATTGVIAGDYDNDGDLDLYVTNYHEPNLLLQNQLVESGVADFVDVTASTVPPGDDPVQAGVGVGVWEGHKLLTLSMTAAWADVNRDGWLDLYVGNHNGHYPAGDFGAKPGERDVLYLNQGDGTFLDVTDAARAQGWISESGGFITAIQEYSSTNAVIFADLDDDRWPDLIVTNKLRHANDRDMIYRNLGDSPDGEWLGFRPITYDLVPTFGNTNPLAMGIAAGDVDRDGDLDFYVTDWAPYGTVPGPNELWINTWSETGEVGFQVAPCCTGAYAWGVQIVDLDNDGLLDVHVATNSGFSDLVYRHASSSAATGWTSVAAAWGLAQGGNARGDMAADVDRDGWSDLFVVNSGAAPRLYRNFSAEVIGPRRWLSVYLVGAPELPGSYRSTRDAMGARVYATADFDGDGVADRQLMEVLSGHSNAASTSSLEAELGLGIASSVDLEVVWPSGRVTNLEAVAADQHLVVDEAEESP